MQINFISLSIMFCFGSPFLAMGSILVHYKIRRIVWRRNKRQGRKSLGFCPSSSALGLALMFLQVIYRPAVAYVIEEKQDEDADAEDGGEPETVNKQLHRQLRRIRRGEPVDRLVLRL